MLINFGGKTYRIYFGYTKIDSFDKGEKFEHTQKGGLKYMFEPPLPGAAKTEYITSAVLEVKSETEKDPKKMWEGMAVESATLHAHDTFNKDTGRKVALTKILNNYPDKSYREFRKAVWDAYINRSKATVDEYYIKPKDKAGCDTLIEEINKLKATLT